MTSGYYHYFSCYVFTNYFYIMKSQMMIQNQQPHQDKESLFHRKEVRTGVEALPGAQGNHVSGGNDFDSELHAAQGKLGPRRRSAEFCCLFFKAPLPAPPSKHICIRFTAPEEKHTPRRHSANICNESKKKKNIPG